MNSYTVTDLQKAKRDLEASVKAFLDDFQKRTGLQVHSVDVQRRSAAIGQPHLTEVQVYVEVRLP